MMSAKVNGKSDAYMSNNSSTAEKTADSLFLLKDGSTFSVTHW